MAEDGTKYSELEGEERKQDLDYIRGRWSQLYNVSQEAKKDAVKFIAFVNAGGAATTLAFIGALVNKGEQYFPLNYAVGFFVAGIVLCGIAHGVDNLHISGLFDKWRKSVAQFYEDKIGFSTMLAEDAKRSEGASNAGFFVWIGGGLFVVGCVVGTWRLF